MKFKSMVISLIAVLFLGFLTVAEAKMRNYSYPYDISQLEWQLLNWTAAWRGTTILTDPFTLDRLECDRDGWIVNVYVTGNSMLGIVDNLQKSVDNITKVFQEKFKEFVPETDLIVHYNLQSFDGTKVYKQYVGGSFKEGEETSEESTKLKIKMQEATGY